jgi:hypothetical protein
MRDHDEYYNPKNLSLSPQPHIVQAAMVHRERRSSEKEACFQSDNL